MPSGGGRSPEKIQIAIIGSVVGLLVVASAWPKLIVPACLLMLVVIWFAARRVRLAPEGATRPRNKLRRIAGIVLALALLLWAILSAKR